MFWSLKTIATLVNYTCKSFIKFDPSIAVIALEQPTSIFHTGKGSFEFLITGIFPLFNTAEISVTGDSYVGLVAWLWSKTNTISISITQAKK